MSDMEERVRELDNNLETSLADIFDTVCQEYNLDTEFIEKELGCKCPFGLIGFINQDSTNG